ncbi:hypothetical protein SCP_0111150 [Sparassis crispa]|uniref:DH domain-containing protein n=1 Tax=Sparassis crispa TaxID=139825 RepID=A0A401G7U3_9APHY|nr:hypothetical protein SCP_0111150 [Sparassis crispa]GBE78232.1 hypothetical protein SCP_0111150 [Sparassis crispa]
MNDRVAAGIPKPLPSPGRDEKLPPPPPEANNAWNPPAPPKVIQNPDPEELGIPSPSAPQTSLDRKPKKSNPLNDLIDSEKVYVDLLTGIIRKVASAWSRSNLPPPELDTMFRSVETIHKANRSLLAKLKQIGTDPSSPKALGDLLMRWIDDLETPYTTYSSKYCCGFDAWEPIQSNERLRTVLAMFSSTHPPPLPASAPLHPAEPPIWTLDELFLLPKGRLKYYRKLYTRLLKSTTPGRSDHRLLSGALEKLERLIATVDERTEVKVGGVPVTQLPRETEDEVVIDMRSHDSIMPLRSFTNGPEQRASDSTHGSNSTSSGERRSNDTAPTSEDRTSVSTLSMPVTDLERRLRTERTLDIFTMQPKQVRLQMAPPTLHYSREVRFSADVVVSVTPRATGAEVVHRRGHVFILTDLLLVCERMTSQERVQNGRDGADMWLLYPPLAGKHLRVVPISSSDTSLSVVIMRKETVIFHTTTPALRDQMVTEFRECIDAATILLPSSKNAAPPPPVPALPSMNGLPQHPRPLLSKDLRQRSTSPPARALSPPRGPGNRYAPQPPYNNPDFDPAIVNGVSGLALHTGHVQTVSTNQSSPMYPPRSSSAVDEPPGQLAHGSSFGPGQMTPPQPHYGALGGQGPQSFTPGQLVRGPSFGSGQVTVPQPVMDGRGPPPPGPLARGPTVGSGRGGPPQPSFEPGQLMPSGSFNPGQHPGQHPGQLMSSQSYGPGPGQMPPPRNPNFRPPPPDSGFRPGMGLPQGPGQGAPGGPPGGPPLSGLPGHPSPYGQPQSRPSSDSSSQGGLRKSPSSRSLRSQPDRTPASAPPVPDYPLDLTDLPPPRPGFLPRTSSSSSLYSLPSSLYAQPHQTLQSAQMSVRSMSIAPSFVDPSPPSSPVEETPPQLGPTTSTISAQMKCKVFLQQYHSQWKSLGTAKLKLYRESPTNIKQLVVEADNRSKSVLISTIVLSDGVERVGKTGVAVELSDKGQRTGIIYMIQLRNETSAQGLFDSLLAGSDRFLPDRP